MRAVIAVVMLAARIAHAQADDKSGAATLFDEGRAALEAKRYDAACMKFEQSILKDPRAVGTLMNLGLCNERQGKVATALARFIEAFDRATEAGQLALRQAAEEHIRALREQVPVAMIAHAGPELEGETLVLDDRVVPRTTKELPLDPGPHLVTYTAPGHLPYSTTVVAKVATRVAIKLPVLERPRAGTNPKRFAGKLATVAGVTLTVTAIGLAIYARQKYDAQFEGAQPHCGAFPRVEGRDVCDDIGQRATESATRLMTGSFVVGGVGLVALAFGIVLWRGTF